MSNSRARNTRVFTVSFPESLAQQVEQVAKEESRNISELFREAFRAYQFFLLERELDKIRQTLPPTPYTEDDVEELVHEIRRERNESRQK